MVLLALEEIDMGHVLLVYRITPSGPDVLDALKEKLNGIGAINTVEQPIGFGITALRVTFRIPDGEGVQDELENKFGDIPEIGDFENEMATREM